MPQRPAIRLPRMIYLMGCWLMVATSHFTLCGWLAWKINVPRMPVFVEAIDPLVGLSGFTISAAVELLWLLLWWSIVALTFWGAVILIRGANWLWSIAIRFEKEPLPSSSAIEESATAMWPVLTMSLLDLLMLPAGALNQPQSPTGLETAAILTWAEWSEFLISSLTVMAGLAWFVAVLLVLFYHIPDRVGGCLLGLLSGGTLLVAVCGMAGWIWLTNDWLQRCNSHLGFVGTTGLIFSAVAMFICLPLHLRQSRQPSHSGP